ncbi:hypothetical protein ACH4RA_00480 [Streptomyces smyrnaeus]|uniref:hypothetical protein n=1 Tax=Streptomyces TaxID=1883 RepID=UPI000C17FDDE|nr:MULTISPECIES: hypothetical protein [unclassified Streptomyces]MBQ0862653.1 hypothetical protein [Streptomyces sp. RK75]MBQ1119338.1 hypothetical protein [Streptomyces sp. B15]MBQ1160325.1 hypothetical protein [Streptomyces sp. A73]
MPEANSPSSPARARTDDSAPAEDAGSAPPEQSGPHQPTGQGERSGDGESAGQGEPAGQGGEPNDGESCEGESYEDEEDRPALTPRQARRIRIVLSAVVMLAVAVALVVRLGSAPSVLTVGFYGIALILSGTAIALSRRGRTRVATAVLGLGFVLVVFGEWLLGFSGGP